MINNCCWCELVDIPPLVPSMADSQLKRIIQSLQRCPSASLDGNCDAWLTENSLAVESAIALIPAEKQPIARAFARGIYPVSSVFELNQIT